MLRERVIPALLLQGAGLVKTQRFEKPAYVGDPMNVVKIFNEKEVDELFLFDIDASKQGRGPNFSLIESIVSEAFMPVAYGGGIRSVEDGRRLLALGVEKLALNTAALKDVSLVTALSQAFGAQCVVGVVDVKRTRLGQPRVFSHADVEPPERAPLRWAKALEAAGAGEILVQAVDRDGTLGGLDVELLRTLQGQLGVPLVAAGGANDVEGLLEAFRAGGLSAVAVGARFVFIGPHRAVLVTYLTDDERRRLSSAFGNA